MKTRSQSKISNALPEEIMSYADITKINLDSQETPSKLSLPSTKSLTPTHEKTTEVQIYPKDIKQTSSNLNDLWLNDAHIENYFKSFTEYISKFRDDTLLFGPNLSQLFKLGSNLDVLTNLTNLSFDQINIAFFCINNHNDIKNETLRSDWRGSHWSLLVFNRIRQTFFHYDSILGANTKQARKLAKKINPIFHFLERDTVQQTDSFSCGLHILVNAKSIIDELINDCPDPKNPNDHSKAINLNHIDSDESKATSSISDDCSRVNITDTVFDCFIDNKAESNYCRLKNKHTQTGTYKNTKNNKNKISNDNVETKTNFREKQTSPLLCKNRFLPLETHNEKGNEEELKEETNINHTIKFKTATCQPKVNQMCYIGPKLKPSISINRSKNCHKTKKTNTFTIEPTYTVTNHGKPVQSNQITLQIDQQTSKNVNIADNDKKIKINLLADSHGRYINEILTKTIEHRKFNISSMIKPCARSKNVLQQPTISSKHTGKNDFLIIITGTNDIGQSNDFIKDQNEIISNVEKALRETNNTNVLVSALPYRYDKPYLNPFIEKVNYNIECMVSKYAHVRYINLSDFDRTCHTTQGLHLNYKGKHKLVQTLITEINNVLSPRIPVVISNRPSNNCGILGHFEESYVTNKAHRLNTPFLEYKDILLTLP